MASAHDSPRVVRCDCCGGREADGLDEHGYALCPRCAGRMRGYREGAAHASQAMLAASIAAALEEGLTANAIRQLVEEVLSPREEDP
jgi:uncharacterized paraquat-inducible protein A